MPLVVGHRLAYGHVPKTGGTWIGHVLEAAGIATHVQLHGRGWRSHLPLREARDRGWLDGRVVVGSVRSPLTWYPSWVAHMRQPGRALEEVAVHVGWSADALCRALADPADLSIDGTWLPTSGQREPWIAWCREHGGGLYIYLLRQILGDEEGGPLVHALLRQEHLGADLAALLEAIGEWADLETAPLNAAADRGRPWRLDELAPETQALLAVEPADPWGLAGPDKFVSVSRSAGADTLRPCQPRPPSRT